MIRSKWRLFFGFLAVVCAVSSALDAQQITLESIKVYPQGETSPDARLKGLRTLRDAYHPWTPPATKEEWEREAARIRTQLLVSNGLWPMWPRTPLNAVVHGEIERDDYIVRRVFFESLPGHYVSGNLYRPKQISGKVPGILCPHGHWTDARFYDAGQETAEKLIEQGDEKRISGARHPLQARMVHLARMGCIVFHYDMVGSADSKKIPHASGFTDAQAGLWLQNAMGLQTWNSLRALDFLTSLPEVDTDRIGMTGASGGGTQTFVLSALDPRIDVAFPAVMVSTAMQGGCICENADYLRQGINNIAFAALFAPKPLGMTGANDWTIDIETKGLPELQQVYSLYGEKDKVYAECHPEFGHNYNAVSRRIMYEWMKQHLPLDESVSVEERAFDPIPGEELSVFTDEYPLPENATDAAGVRKYLTEVMTRQYAELLPEDKEELDAYRNVVEPAARVMLVDKVAGERDMEARFAEVGRAESYRVVKGVYSVKGERQSIPIVMIDPPSGLKGLVFWIDPSGKSHLFAEDGSLRPETKNLIDAKYAVVSVDLLYTGELVGAEGIKSIPVDENYSGYTFGYNRTTIAHRVRDVVNAVGTLSNTKNARVILVGTESMGIVALLARTQLADIVHHTIVNLNGFSFSKIDSTQDPFYLPGALRYGGVGGLAGLAAPHDVTVAGWKNVAEREKQGLEACYNASGGKLQLVDDDLSRMEIVERILNAQTD